MWYWLFAKYNLSRFLWISFLLFAAGHGLQAGLIAHYDLSDGDLLDNEVGPAHALRAVQVDEAASVRLNALEGAAVFPGGRPVTAYLQADGPGELEAYTVSFWFRTERDFLGFPHLDLFASHTDIDPGKQGIVEPVRDALGNRIGQRRLPDWPGKRVHAADVWQHVLLRRTSERTEIYYTTLGDQLGEPVLDDTGIDASLDQFVLGFNRGKDSRHRVELANVKVFDDAGVSVEGLFAEGPGTETVEQVSLFRSGRKLKELDAEAAHVRAELSKLPVYDDSLQLDAYGYHSGYLPALDAVPETPRWTVELEAGLPYNFLEFYLIPAADRRVVERPGYGFPLRFRILSINLNGESTVLADWRDRDYPNPGRYPARFAGTDDSLQRIVLEVYRGQLEGEREFFALDEAFVCARYFVSQVSAVKASASFESPPFWSIHYLNDQKTSYGLPVLRRSDGAEGSADFITQFAQPLQQSAILDLDLQANKHIDLIELYPAHPPEGIVVPGYGFPGSIRIETFSESAQGERVLDKIRDERQLANPGNNAVRFHGRAKLIRWIRLTMEQLPVHDGRQTFALGEIGIRGLMESHSEDARVTLDFGAQGVTGYLSLLTDGKAGGAAVVPMLQWLDGLGRRRTLSQRLEQVEALQLEMSERRARFFRVALVVALVVIIGLLIWVAVNAVLQRRRHAQRLRQQITTDLHDDIGSRMSAIALATTYLRKVSADPKVHERSGKIERIAREMQASLGEVLWFTNFETDSLRQMVGKLIDVAELRVPPEQLCIETTPLKQIPDTRLRVLFKRDLLLLFKEVVNNAAKHADASEIKLEIRWRRSWLLVAVSDNGKGFVVAEEQAKQHKRPHLGLNSIQRRADRLGAKLKIESTPGKGTTVSVKVKP